MKKIDQTKIIKLLDFTGEEEFLFYMNTVEKKSESLDA